MKLSLLASAMAFVSTKTDALKQRVSDQSSSGHNLPISAEPPSCLKQGMGRGCTMSLTFQLNSRGIYLIQRREVCNSYQKWNADEIKVRAEGRRMANPKPRYSQEATKRYADKLARQFGKKQQSENTEVALPANRRIVLDRSFLLDNGASNNIIGRSEITESEWLTLRKIPPITLNTASKQITIDETVEMYVR